VKAHAPATGGADPGAERLGQVDARVKEIAAGTVVIADRPGDRADEAQRRARRRPAQRGERPRPGDAVGCQPGPGLEAPHGVDDQTLAAVPDCVRAFLGFLEERGSLAGEPLEQLEHALGKLRDVFDQRARDNSQWGLGSGDWR